MKKKIIILTLGILLAAATLSPMSALAQTGNPPDYFPDEDSEVGELDVQLGEARPYQVAARLINWSLGLLGLFALVLILYGGFIWMNARGNEEEVKKAKKILEGAIIGLVIILASFGISQYVFENLVNITQ